jgi:uncharacterized membrane protein
MWKSPWTRWGVLLGVALGGFFDGILLHQILQWHHLLSLVPGLADLRTQVLWDGYFHALMYVVVLVAFWGLWRARGTSGDGWRGPLAGALLAGFGLWHILDGIASHWVLGIHRIKIDSPNPLIWDLIWFAAFGLAPLVSGWFMLRGARPHSPPPGSTLTVLLLGVLTIGAAGWSLKPPKNQAFTTVVFAPGISPQRAWAAVAAADARVVWTDPSMDVVILDAPAERRWSFYRAGALLVSGSGLPAGCASWSRV